MSGCNMRMPVTEAAKQAGSHTAFCDYYLKGYGDCTCGAAIITCGKEIIRDGKCEEHKIDRRQRYDGERRRQYSTDSPSSCGNGLCHTELVNDEPTTRHDTRCPDYGPGWA